MKDVLLAELLSVLRAEPAGIGEYELLQAVKNHPAVLAIEGDGQLALFRKHFLLMNRLYQLQEQLWEEERSVLHISALNIRIETAHSGNGRDVGEAVDSRLRDYYLDWNQFLQTGADDVTAMLNNFWQAFERYCNKDEALTILALEPGASQKDIAARYRELAAIHHPDKGGDAEKFIEIRSAYESLRSR